VEELIRQVCSMLEEPALGAAFMEAVRQAKPRYLRDQVLLFRQVIESYPSSIIHQALQYSTKHRLNSSVDFRSVVEHLQTHQATESAGARIIHMNPFTGKMPSEAFIQPATSSIADYYELF
jgi:hypothetical protein